MYKDLDDKCFDHVVIGTSLCDTILSSYLAKCGKKILHLDISKVYGGDCKNLSYRDLENCKICLIKIDLNDYKNGKIYDQYLNNLVLIKEQYNIENFSQVEKIRDYIFDFNPKLTFGRSKTVDELCETRAAQYLEFLSIKKIFLFESERLLTAPSSKSEIFSSNDLSLIEKQKLLNFIYAVMKIKNTAPDVNTTVEFKKDYEVENEIYAEIQQNLTNNGVFYIKSAFSPLLSNIILLIMANIDPNKDCEYTLDKLIDNIYNYLNSLSVYGQTPYIIPLYGSSEFSQALSRMSSVYGTIYVINETFDIKIARNNENFVDPSNPFFVVDVIDHSNGERFFVRTNQLIVNESLTDKIEFMEGIFEKNESTNLGKFEEQFICFYILQNDTKLRKNGCPLLYKIPSIENSENPYGAVVYESDQSNNCAPRNRSIVQLVVNSHNSDSESSFLEKSISLCEKFITQHIENIKLEINENMSSPDEDLKSYLEKADIDTDVKLFATLQFLRNMKKNTSSNITSDYNDKIVITRNDYANDTDFYYHESEKIIKTNKWDSFEQIEIQNNFVSFNEEYSENPKEKLIDELFDMIELNKDSTD